MVRLRVGLVAVDIAAPEHHPMMLATNHVVCGCIVICFIISGMLRSTSKVTVLTWNAEKHFHLPFIAASAASRRGVPLRPSSALHPAGGRRL